ncbi:MAG: carbohydrate binding family 9 domain-containing protein [Longimicrobiales bacterium]|nr:carbohydrate binding family 9 domain-containing protein [Longimicrobiales bacterium]
MIPALFQLAVAGAAVVGSAEAELRPPAPGVVELGERLVEVVRYDGTRAEVEIETPSVASAEIDVDGRLDDAAWGQAALLEGFTQFRPIEGSEATQRTEVLVLVDDDAIYFAVKAFDEDPSGIRATLTERDGFAYTDDYVRFILDTFDDQRRGYVFTINPFGVQHDGLWNETGGGTGRRGRGMFSPIDDSPDFLWDSDAEMTEWGYQAEIRIPFKSLRFPELEEQSWGLQVERKIQRTGFESSWAPITASVANRLTQAGKLNGLRGLDMGLFMEVNPFVTGARNGALDDSDNFVHSNPTGEFGFNATYGITSNLTLDGTFNPDFSQVEADAGQVQVNERFALFFAEARPFFLEGTEIFGMPKQLVYTRTIQNPIAGGKLTGKVGGLNVGYLGAVDETFSSDAGNVYVNLLRARADVGASSTIGAVYTDRTANASEFNRVAGADARIQLGGRYTVTVMGARSFTNEASFSERRDGTMGSLRLERAGRTFQYSAEFEDTQGAFNPGSGFFQRLGTAQANSRASYTWFGRRGALLESIAPSVEAKAFWDHDRFWGGQGFEEGEVQLSSRFGFKNNITIWGNYQLSRFQYQPEQYEGLFVQGSGGSTQPFRPDQEEFDLLPSTTVGIWVNKWQKIRGNVRFTRSQRPIFDRFYRVAVEPANSLSGEARLNLYPTNSLSAEVGANWSRLTRKSDGVEHSTAIIPRVRVRYQFSRALFLRSIFEYGSQESLSLQDPASGLPLVSCGDTDCFERSGGVSNDFRIEGLLGYEPSPGTVFFFGYTRQMRDARAFGFEDVRPTADGLFLKLSYRFRM